MAKVQPILVTNHHSAWKRPLPELGWVQAVVVTAEWHPDSRHPDGGRAELGLQMLNGEDAGAYVRISSQLDFIDMSELKDYAWSLGSPVDPRKDPKASVEGCRGKYLTVFITRNAQSDEGGVWYGIDAIRPVNPEDVPALQVARENIGSVAEANYKRLMRPFKPVEGATLPKAKPFDWEAAERIKPRPWLAGNLVLRGELSTLIGDGGSGKSTLLVSLALSLASGRNLIGIEPRDGPQSVWMISLEENEQELARRIRAAMLAHKVERHELGDRLRVNGKGAELCLVSSGREGIAVDQVAVSRLRREIDLNGIDVVMIDPFVSIHRVNENDNTAMDVVAKTICGIADMTKCAVIVTPHTKKMGGDQVDTDDMRGASAVKDAARINVAINPMMRKQAEEFGLSSHHGYFSISQDGKANYTAKSSRKDWFKLTNQILPNGVDTFGEDVGVVKSWQPPQLRFSVTAEQLEAIGVEIGKGECRKDVQAKDYVGKAVARIVGANPDDKQTMAGIKLIVARWLKEGALIEVQRPDASRDLKAYVALGNWSVASNNSLA